MDSYQKDNPKTEKPKPLEGAGGTGRLGGSPRLDTFQSSRTAPLSQLGATRRLGSASLPAEQSLALLKVEVENGETLIEKLLPRMAVLERARAIQHRPNDVGRICAGIGAGEANFTRQVALALQDSPQLLRQVQVALFQWEQARTGVAAAREAHDEALTLEGRARDIYVENHCHVEKLRGQLYPLVNLPVVFKDHPLIAQLIPVPKTPVTPPPPAPLPPSQVQPAVGGSALGAGEALDPDQAVEELVNTFKALTGSLRDKLSNWLTPPRNQPPS